MDYDHEMIPKSKDWDERHNPSSKLPNFNTRRILIPESQAVNEYLKLTKAPADPESSKESGSEPLTPLPPLRVLQGASPSSEVMPLTYQDHSPRERPSLGTMKHTSLTHKNLQRHMREPICYMDSGCSRCKTGVKSYLHKYVEQIGPKVVFGDNLSCITEGYGSKKLPNGNALRKCILEGPYTPSIVIIQAVSATDDSSKVLE
ncbi:hypothetical protein Tco_1147091 [Tanacetum coccineum]